MSKSRSSRRGAARTNHRYKIRWTDRARSDLLAIGDFIAIDDEEAAARWVGTLMVAVERVARFPLSGRVVPEIDNAAIREVIRERYRILYRVGDGIIEVLTVFAGHRRFPDRLVPESQRV